MQVNTAAFLKEQDLPFQRIAPYFDAAQRRGEPGKSGASAVDTKNLDKLKSTLAEHNITLKFSRDETTGAVVVEMVDNRTGEAIRQIPSTVSLTLAAHFIKLRGQFIDEKE